MEKLIRVSRGLEKADLVLKNGKIVNVFTHQILEKDLAIADGRIAGIGSYEGKKEVDLKGKYILPGLIDAHLHIESSMAIPSVLSGVLLSHGVTTVITDPHEIVNAAGKAGLDFMLEDAHHAAIDYFFMIPSSVPSCDFEVNGAGKFLASDMEEYKDRDNVLGLAEAMRFFDVINQNPEMKAKLDLFADQMIDGHAPGLDGKDLQAYRAAGVANDHEAVSIEEAVERLQDGFHLLIREGSGARNLKEILGGLLERQIPLNNCSFCTDDKHLEDIFEEGTIDWCLKEAVQIGCNPMDAVCMATINTASHYHLRQKGAIAPGFDADLAVVEDLTSFTVDSVYKAGEKVFPASKEQETGYADIPLALSRSVQLPEIRAEDIVLSTEDGEADLIEIISSQLLTRHLRQKIDPEALPDQEYNLLLSVERYGKTQEFACCLVKGFHIKNGAVAETYAHDSHNVIAAGDSVSDVLLAVSKLQENQGGYVLVENGEVFDALPAKAAGMMSDEPAEIICEKISRMKKKAREMGVPQGVDPFATLSFLSLPVIPEIRLTVKGLYDVTNQTLLGKEEEAKIQSQKE